MIIGVRHKYLAEVFCESCFATFTFLLLSFLLYPRAEPQQVIAATQPPASPSISLSFPSGPSVSLTIDPNVFNSVSQTINASTTNASGYTITMETSGASTNLTSASTSVVIPTLSTSAGVQSSSFNNNYGYSKNGTIYYPAPAVNGAGDEIRTTSTANSTTDSFGLTFGAKVDSSIPYGAYTNSFSIAMTANALGYTIAYNKNAGNETVTNMPTTQQGSVTDFYVTLSSSTPARSGYLFLGWSESSSATTATYSPGDTFYLDPTSNNNVTLYAVWKNTAVTIIYDANNGVGEMSSSVYKYENKRDGDSFDLQYGYNYKRTGYGFAGFSPDPNAGTKLIDNNASNDPVVFGPNEYVTLPVGFSEYADNGVVKLYAVWIASQGTMQGWGGCSSLGLNKVTALTDSRDNNVYAIAKFGDEKCWMIENLRLNLETVTITNTNTNNPTNTFKTATLSHISSSNTEFDSSHYDYVKYNLNSIDNSYSPSYNSTTDKLWYGYGGFYNWYTATAGNGTYSLSSGGTNIDGDICPSGWSLPTGYDTTGQFSLHDVGLGGSGSNESSNAASRRWRVYPSNTVYAGFYKVSTFSNRGTYGHYWSSSVWNSYNAYISTISNSSALPGTGQGAKYYGFSIRCLSKDQQTFTLTYNANGGTGAPASQTSTGHGIAEFTISSTVPTRSGFTFQGWMDSNGDMIGTSGDVITIGDTNKTLYARWTNNSCRPTATTISQAVCLQDVNQAVKSTMVLNTVYNLKDARDDKSYTVSLLGDGQVWMTKNLSLGGDSELLLTPYDTDLPQGTMFTLPASTTNFSNSTTVPKLLIDSTYGGYYNFAAAIASSDSHTVQGDNVTTSICPAGWDLPTRAQYSRFRDETGVNSYSTASVSPYYFVYGGYRSGTSYYSQTSATRLWTSTVYSSYYAYYSGGYTYPSYEYMYYGQSVRCILSSGLGTIHYDANGGTGSMTDQTNIEINVATIKSNGFTAPDHKSFKNWCTNADGTGVCVSSGAAASSIPFTNGVATLYANWQDIYIITYVNTVNNSTVTSNVVVGNNEYTKSSSTWSRTGYRLMGWDTNSAGTTIVYNTSTSFTPTGDTTLYSVWIPTYTLAYDGNGADEGTMTNVMHTNVVEGDVFHLFASNYSKDGYGFAGWSLNPNAQPGDGTSTIYGPNETFTAPSSSTSGETKTLYAVWVASAGNLQNWTSCNTLQIGGVTALTDTRDNQTYAVGRLADGSCWMIENLRLDADYTTSSANIAKAQGYAGAFVGLADSEAKANFSTSGPTNSLYSSSNITGDNLALRMPRYNNINTSSRVASPSAIDNRNSNNTVHSSLSGDIFSYGNYYTWAAGIADTDNYGSNNRERSTSICPKGWHLPTSYARNSEYVTLDKNMSGGGNNVSNSGWEVSARWRTYPTNFVYSGLATSSSSTGSSAYYLSASSYSNGEAYYYNMYQGALYLYGNSYSNNKALGFTVRCIADGTKTISNLTYLQDFSTISRADKASVMKSMNLNTLYQLKDNRDNRTYSIAKLKDGNIWMISNLDLGRSNLSVNLTPSNTNITNTITASTFNSWKVTTPSYDGNPHYILVSGSDPTSGTSYGTLYNYKAASAGDIVNSKAKHDLCPAGWRLPINYYYDEGYKYEFAVLYGYYNTPALMIGSVSSGGAGFARAGSVSGGNSVSSTGSTGIYWTDDEYSKLNLSSSSVLTSSGYTATGEAHSIRCILELTDFRN